MEGRDHRKTWSATRASRPTRSPRSVGMFGSGQWTVFEGYAASKLYKAGFRSNNIDPNARHCMASAVGRLHPCLRFRRADGLLRRPRARRCLCAVGLEHGRDAPGAVVTSDRHPPDQAGLRGARAVDLRASQLRTGRPRRDLQAADRSGDPELHRQLHRAARCGQLGLRQRPCELHQDHADRYRLRPAPDRSAREECQECRQGQAQPDRFRAVQKGSRALHRRVCLRAVGCFRREPGKTGQAVCRPEQEDRVVLDHGFQSAYSWLLGEWSDVQRAPADRQDLRAGQWSVLADRSAVGLRHRARGRHFCAPSAGGSGGRQA